MRTACGLAGLYATAPRTMNLPPVPAGTQVGLLEVLAGSGGDALHQRWTANSADGNVRGWQRRASGGLWQAWALIFNQSTLLGTVSHSAGLPTGAVIERGYERERRVRAFCRRHPDLHPQPTLSAASLDRDRGDVPVCRRRPGPFRLPLPLPRSSAGRPMMRDAWLTAGAPGGNRRHAAASLSQPMTKAARR